MWYIYIHRESERERHTHLNGTREYPRKIVLEKKAEFIYSFAERVRAEKRSKEVQFCPALLEADANLTCNVIMLSSLTLPNHMISLIYLCSGDLGVGVAGRMFVPPAAAAAGCNCY